MTSYTGTKSLAENLAYLPTTIMRFLNDTPVFAQWNYRILCHKLKTHVPLTKFKPVEDLASRMMRKVNMKSYEMSRAAKFELSLSKDNNRFKERPTLHSFLDVLMEEIPGKDNYVVNNTMEGLMQRLWIWLEKQERMYHVTIVGLN